MMLRNKFLLLYNVDVITHLQILRFDSRMKNIAPGLVMCTLCSGRLLVLLIIIFAALVLDTANRLVFSDEKYKIFSCLNSSFLDG